MKIYSYFVYITTNPGKSVLYVGVTNDLAIRVNQHFENRGNAETFAGNYYCYNLLYWEPFQRIQEAIAREKEIKGWSRKKKEELIATTNPKKAFLLVS